MKAVRWTALLMLACAAQASADGGAADVAADVAGCTEHPLLPRLPGYVISKCRNEPLGTLAFPTGASPQTCESPPSQPVEGALWIVDYEYRGTGTRPDAAQIARHFLGVARAGGAAVVHEYGAEGTPRQLCGDLRIDRGGYRDHAAVYRLTEGGRELWAFVGPFARGTWYRIAIVERKR